MDRQTLGEMDLPAHIWEPFAQSRAAIRCSPGFLIYLQGTEATCFYYLKEGRVKSFARSSRLRSPPDRALTGRRRRSGVNRKSCKYPAT